MARESQAKRIKRTAAVYAALKKQFPDAKCSLDYQNPLQLLVATILSAQCTDVRVNIVTKDLFKKYKTVRDFARASQETFEQDIRSTGFYRNKARNIIAAAAIINNFGGGVPDTMDELLSLPGVARKTANVILSNAFGKNEGFVVDTHVKRLSARLGLSSQSNPVKIEQDMMELSPREEWATFGHLLVFHGRAFCTARKPDCPGCPIAEYCPSAGKI
ncbi:MAG: endonuclease III [Phycisphaerae bacterium]|nr:endonuclease III [Phycisphaerae bacterium]